ncbi:excalibur calcium-binding domain-containing protein [Asanoa ishikariensis]|nr:excalibur calcium-binding domain-containing protein [Asanoa ishikariensis]
MSYPPPPVASNWFTRLSPLRRVGVILGACLLLCCGGAAGFVALLPGDDGPSAERQAAVVAPNTAAATDPAPTTADPTPPADPTSDPEPTAPAEPTTEPSPAPVSYANCAAVRAAGKAPLRKGRPGYRAGLDADRDGVACESATRANGGDAPNPPPKPKPKVEQPTTDPRFDTCKDAIAHGYGPYRRGETEYGWYRDGDNDGVVCE